MGRTPTSILIRLMEWEKNPVTRAVYRQIIGNRIDDARHNSMEKKREKRAEAEREQKG